VISHLRAVLYVGAEGLLIDLDISQPNQGRLPNDEELRLLDE